MSGNRDCKKPACPCRQSGNVTPWQMGEATQGEERTVRCSLCGDPFPRLFEDHWCPGCMGTMYPHQRKHQP